MDLLIAHIYFWKKDINDNDPPCIDCEMVSKYSTIFFENFSEYFINFMET